MASTLFRNDVALAGKAQHDGAETPPSLLGSTAFTLLMHLSFIEMLPRGLHRDTSTRVAD